MATKRKRGEVWEYVVKRSAVLAKPLYFTFRDEGEGDAYVRRLEQLLDRGIVPDELNKPAVEREARLRKGIGEYLAAVHVTDDDRALLKLLRERLPAALQYREVTFEWAQAWVSAMKREQNLSPSRVRHYVGALARCCDWLLARGDLPLNPLRSLPKGYATYTPEDARHVGAIEGGVVKLSEERDRRLRPGEEARIRAVLAGEKPAGRQRPLELHHQAMLQALFDLALESAMRLREMYTLDIGQVDFKAKTIFLDRTKNGSKRQVPMTSVALRVMRKAIGKRKAGRVFPWWAGQRDAAALKRTTSLLSRQFDRVFGAAGCPDLHFHDLRHEATSRLYERTTLTDLQIAKITGHRDLRSLARYANLRGSDLAARLW